MQAENNKNNIHTITFGCRLNAVESEKIAKMLCNVVPQAIVVNTCAVTGEAERQSGQYVRRVARDNPNTPILITGCAASHDSAPFADINNIRVIHNRDKLNQSAYINAVRDFDFTQHTETIRVTNPDRPMSKQFIQIQNGCNHDCTYCITRLLRGPSCSFEYDSILSDVRLAIDAGHSEIVLVGVDSASYHKLYDNKPFLISDLCRKLLDEVPEIKRLRLSSVDPASPEIFKIIDLIHENPRMMPHLHLSMQSGSDTILRNMRRRHTNKMVRNIVAYGADITFSWDIICGFPGETEELFAETMQLVKETRPIKIHAFPFSARPGTPAATMPNQISKNISKQRVKEITDVAAHNRDDFMFNQIGKRVSVLAEEHNTGRTENDIPVIILGEPIQNRTIIECKVIGVDGKSFIASR